MAILFQRLNENMIINGWYGKCHADDGSLVDIDNCPHFDLMSAGNNIKAVYWFQDDMVVQSYTRGIPYIYKTLRDLNVVVRISYTLRKVMVRLIYHISLHLILIKIPHKEFQIVMLVIQVIHLTMVNLKIKF